MCGLRIGEVCGLKWEDVDLKNRFITVKRTTHRVYEASLDSQEGKSTVTTGTPKTRRSQRKVPIPRKLVFYLTQLKGTGKAWWDFLYHNRQDQVQRAENIQWGILLRTQIMRDRKAYIPFAPPYLCYKSSAEWNECRNTLKNSWALRCQGNAFTLLPSIKQGSLERYRCNSHLKASSSAGKTPSCWTNLLLTSPNSHRMQISLRIQP